MVGVSLVALSARVGEQVISLADVAKQFDTTESQVTKATGITALYKFPLTTDLSAIAADMIVRILAASHVDMAQVVGWSTSTQPDHNLVPGIEMGIAGYYKEFTDKITTAAGFGCVAGIEVLASAYMYAIHYCTPEQPYYLAVVSETPNVMLSGDAATGQLFSDGIAVALLKVNFEDEKTGFSIKRPLVRTLKATSGLRVGNPFKGEKPCLQMDGREIYRFATDAKVYRTILDAAEMEVLEENTYFIPHQANLRILRKMQETNNIPDSQFYVKGIQTIGNTAAVSVFLGLYDVLQNSLAPKGTKHFLLGAFGMGGKSGGVLLTINGNVLLV